ncbi:uncharacterized protein LOC144555249 isoform X1 [Carex rostrata]
MERESHELDASVPLPSTKRLKVLPPPPSKGKEKSEVDPQTCSNPTPEEEEERCGICLTGSTQSIRGQIDSCNHHFCFVCVMEWAKIETRCPLCKQRFGSIRRPAVPGLFPSERVVKISERNQVYHPLGIESSTVNNLHLDPNCIVCHSSEKDAYLLLCELCSINCHTHCVGLGADIPEGEWYCPDCTIAKNEYLKTQPDDESPFPDQETKEKIRKIRQGGSSISISDFVAYPNEDNTMNSTLSCSHHRMERIRRLRENWDQLRSGELQFSSEVLKPNYRSGHNRRGNPSSASSSEVMIEQSCREADASRAWKMMDIAKSACADRAPKTPSQSLSRSSKSGKAVCHKLHASKRNRKETKGKEVSASTYQTYPATALCKNGPYKLSMEETAQGRCNQLVPQLGPMCDGLDFQVKPESNWGSQTVSVDRVSGCDFSDLGNRREIETSDRRDGKDMVQSLVKLSLKALDKDKKLGTNKFKEIARISTHTILAACGMEHSKSVARPFSKVSCNHHGEIESHLLPGSCQQCFSIFLQEIVESVFSENSGCIGAG